MTDKLKAIIHGVTGESPKTLIELLGEEIRATLFLNPEDYFAMTRETMHPDDRIGADIVGTVYEVELTVKRINTIATRANSADEEDHEYGD